ncbi:RNA polymerase sigma factor SigJ [Pseudonocardia benzenivorans]|uniref:RNA polymerase, sigma-24 subunit, ECF subfamily n=2 Tax=Pseudonocardia TaxID=1847 RepID=F4CSI6_PSEUX|nr:RNA polymerase sigma factor SigJ [Pseudonocardia dioxanivorans]AEA23391.1 RNA polymerase, sigma-24 subunit, ECF subfamily [Pseudonocardia dioxanivorans CB1190]GJF04314.1 RNA polymerase sigma factor [Pseudonocardia sp. D17]
MTDGTDPAIDVVVRERRQLLNLAYRLLGSLAEAEDAVQETYARWYGLSDEGRRGIGNPGAWLTRVAGRVCLDQLRSARAARETYVGDWVPEPLPEPADPADPASQVTLDESVTMAFLVVLDAMTPAERVAFVLHDVFRYPFAEVAEVVGRTPAACRQLATSARRRIGAAPAAVSGAAGQAAVVRDFRRAWEAKDIAALVGLLDPDVVAVADGGGVVPAHREPIRGGEQVARAYVEISRVAPGVTLLERTVNGLPGLVARKDGATLTVFAFDVVAGRITRIWAVRNPAKLRTWAPA